MKNKGNKLLAVALLGLSVMLVGCGEDEDKLTDAQKNTFVALSDKATVGIGQATADFGYTYGNATAIEADGATTPETLKVAYPANSVFEVEDSSDNSIKDKIKVSSAKVTYVAANKDSSNTVVGTVDIYQLDSSKTDGSLKLKTGDTANQKLVSYKLTLGIDVTIAARGDESSKNASVTLVYDTTDGNRVASCPNDPSTNSTFKEILSGSKVYAAIGTGEKLLICK